MHRHSSDRARAPREAGGEEMRVTDLHPIIRQYCNKAWILSRYRYCGIRARGYESGCFNIPENEHQFSSQEGANLENEWSRNLRTRGHWRKRKQKQSELLAQDLGEKELNTIELREVKVPDQESESDIYPETLLYWDLRASGPVLLCFKHALTQHPSTAGLSSANNTASRNFVSARRFTGQWCAIA